MQAAIQIGLRQEFDNEEINEMYRLRLMIDCHDTGRGAHAPPPPGARIARRRWRILRCSYIS